MAESHPSQGVTRESNNSSDNKGTECRYCDSDFESYSARRKHEGAVHTEPYQEESVLRGLYLDDGLSMELIAKRFDTSPNTIRYWIEKHDIQTRDVNEHQERVGVNCALDNRGYMKWSAYVGDNNKHVQVHRLLAVAEYGFDEVCGMVVHHKNNISWDNRPDNIELMTASEHGKHHHGRD